MSNLVYKNFSVVVPSYNESDSVKHVLDEIFKIEEVSELIFVNDGSTVDISEIVKPYSADKRFIYVKHKQNKGKGEALKTGVKKAKNEIILFLDADLRNITAAKIKKIASPVLKGEVDLSRGSFQRKRGRVTEFAVKPMMKILFPEMYFEQPISGQICAKKSFLTTVDFESRYGVDIGLLFDAIDGGQRIIEVNIGKLDHKANSAENIAEMSRQVLETMIKKAGLIQHKYKLVIFTLDDTLIPKKSLTQIFKKLKIEDDLFAIKSEIGEKDANLKHLMSKMASSFSGTDAREIEKLCQTIPLSKYAPEIISALKKRKYQVAIISSNFSPVVIPLAKRLGVDLVDCVFLNTRNNIISGEISASSKERWISSDLEKGFKRAFSRILRKTKIKATETIVVASSKKSIPLLASAGLSIAYKPIDKELKDVADKTISVHAEILAIIE